MQGTTQCPTCHAAILVGASFCSTCGVALSWVMPGAAPPTPPPVAPPPPPPSPPPHRSAERRRRPEPERRSGSGAGIWVVAMVAVVAIAGGIIYWKKQQEAAKPAGPVFVAGSSNGGVARGRELSPFLTRLSESYPRFYDDLSYEPPPEPVVPAPKAAHGRTITAEHDSYRNCTFLVLGGGDLRVKGSGGKSGGESGSWTAYFGFHGSTPPGLPHIVTFVFEVGRPGAPYGDDAAIQWIGDGRLVAAVRNSWSEIEVRGAVVSAGISDKDVQRLAFPMKTKALIPVLEAKQVSLRLGTTEFEFGDDDLDALKDLLGRAASGK